MKYDLKASVIIPSFNRKDRLIDLFCALEEQDVDASVRFEVILVDDGSNDNTGDLVQQYITDKQYGFTLRYYNTYLSDCFGASVARNIGIRNARGEYILFLDDDCVPHKKWLMSHLLLLNKGARAIIGNVIQDKKVFVQDDIFLFDSPEMRRLRNVSASNNLTEFISCNCALARECFEKAGLFDERFARKNGYGYEDIEFGHRLLIAGYQIVFNQYAYVYTEKKDAAALAVRDTMRRDAKRVWWHIITHPQENLPITPLLHDYAIKKRAELFAHSRELS